MPNLSGLSQLFRASVQAFRGKKKAKATEAQAPIFEHLRVLESEVYAAADVQGVVREGHILKVVLITEGLGNLRNKNYYGPEAIASAPAAFEGGPCFIDHPSESEDKDIPERRVRNKCGYFKNLRIEQVMDRGTGRMLAACVGELHLDLSESGVLAYGKAITALHYQQEFPASPREYIGLSVNADGKAERRTMTIEGRSLAVNYITRFAEGGGADVVTSPARGGRIVAVVEDSTGAAFVREARMFKKLLQSALATLKLAESEKDAAVKDQKIAEAKKNLTDAEAAVAAVEAEALEAKNKLSKKEGESDADFKARMAKADKKDVEESEEEPVETKKESKRDIEAHRIAVAHLVAEAKVPSSIFDKDDLEALANMSIAEAKREIGRVARICEASRTIVPSYVPKAFAESDKGDAGNKTFVQAFKEAK